MRPNRILGIVALVAGVTLVAGAPTRAARRLTIEHLARDWNEWAGMAPRAIRWSPDGSRLYFEWNPEKAEVSPIYSVSTTGGAPVKIGVEQELLVPPPQPGRGSSDSGPATGVVYNRAGTLVAWEKERDVFLLDLASSKLRRITNTEAVESNVRFSADQGDITYESANNLYAYSLADGQTIQLTNFKTGKDPASKAGYSDIQKYVETQEGELFDVLKKADETQRRQAATAARARGPRPPAFYITDTQSIIELRLAPDERRVTFTLMDHARRNRTRSAEMPKYVTRSGFVETDKQAGLGKATDMVTDFALGILDLGDGSVKWVDSEAFAGKRGVNWNPVTFSEDGQRAFVWAGARDHHDIWLTSIDVATAAARVLFNDHDDAWVRGYRTGRFQRGDGQVSGFMPDNRSIYFLSEKDGWFHLYTVGDDGTVRQLTKGLFELTKPAISRDQTRWYFLSNEAGLGERQLYTMPLAGGARTRLTTRDGWWDNYYVSPDEKQIALEYSSPDAPIELFVMENRAGAAPRAITTSTTAEFREIQWATPEYVRFQDKGGWTVHGELFKPTRPHPARPAIIHVHGTGWTEGVTHQFSSYFPENRPEFQFYADNGYTVLNVDYKASRGYGRESRVSIYRHMGKPEIDSLLAAVDFLVTKQGVNPRNIGIYGHSYGGFVTLMALLTQPGVFAAGAAHAAPTDFAHTALAAFTTRMLDVPWRETEAYQSSSPIYLADRLQDRLLMLNGMEDGPVPFQEAIRFAQRLIELKKTGWELATYPVEGHVLRQESSRLDLQRRRFALFESVLKRNTPPPAAATE
jgi:dipeptidyl aminopeptidase/acylaminoacyl peptidase